MRRTLTPAPCVLAAGVAGMVAAPSPVLPMPTTGVGAGVDTTTATEGAAEGAEEGGGCTHQHEDMIKGEGGGPLIVGGCVGVWLCMCEGCVCRTVASGGGPDEAPDPPLAPSPTIGTNTGVGAGVETETEGGCTEKEA
jgi:hypothetical protein